MFTHKDIENRSVFVINGTKHQALKVSTGRLMLFDTEKEKAITKLPFPKILALIVVGHTTLSSALIEKCNKNGIPLVVMKPNFKPVFYFGDMAEANFLLRKKQFEKPKGDLSIAIEIIKNKTQNQRHLLSRTREKSEKVTQTKQLIDVLLPEMENVNNYSELMGLEGKIAKHFFSSYFEFADWKSRLPRVKQDTINATLDIGYTFLFNYIEGMLRLFGFDPYMGVYHQLWFRRKSLVCDLMEPFRCIIDHQLRKSLKYGTFKSSDFEFNHNAYYLKSENRKKYTKVFYEAIISRKTDIYKYTQQYYRCFMGRKSVTNYPIYNYE